MPKNTKILALISALPILAVLLVFAFRQNQSTETWVSSASTKFHFSISHPQTWQQKEDENLFYLVNSKSKGEFKDYITITNINPFSKVENNREMFDKISAAKDGEDISALYQKDQLTQRIETKIKNTQVDGREAVEISQDTTMPGPYYAYIIYVANGDKIFAIREIASTKEELAQDEPIFNQIIATFKFTQ